MESKFRKSQPCPLLPLYTMLEIVCIAFPHQTAAVDTVTKNNLSDQIVWAQILKTVTAQF
jgi:hypothetical protein